MLFMTLLALVWFRLIFGLRYDGYNAIVAGPVKTEQQKRVLQTMLNRATKNRKVLALQNEVLRDQYVDLLVAPDMVNTVVNSLQKVSIQRQVQSTNVQKTLDETMEENDLRKHNFFSPVSVNFSAQVELPPDYYMENDEMHTYVRELVNSTTNAEYVEFGHSFEGRPIYYVVINGHRSELSGLWLDAGIHCREWLAHATAIHILHTLLKDTSTRASHLRDNYRMYIAPNLNPDGYVYTWTVDRYWRKNRNNNTNNRTRCEGVDLNRNFNVNYKACGTSRNPCSEVFPGSGPASEPETKAVVNALRDIVDNRGGLDMFVSMHSYSQLWLLPWGGTLTKPDDYDELQFVAKAATDAIREVNNAEYPFGTVPGLLYCSAGGSMDWAKNEPVNGTLQGDGAGIKYAYVPELRPRCCGMFAFSPNASLINPSGNEIFAGFYAAAEAMTHGSLNININSAAGGCDLLKFKYVLYLLTFFFYFW